MTLVYTARATGVPTFRPARPGPERSDAQGDILCAYRLVCDDTINVEDDVAEHIADNIPGATVRTTGTGLGNANKVLAATVSLI